MLSTDTESPVVAETAVGADLLEALKIVTELGVDAVGEDLVVLAVNDIALSVEEPRWDLVLGWVLDDGDDALELFGGKLTGTTGERVSMQRSMFLLSAFSSAFATKCRSKGRLPLVEINISLLADQVGVATADTLDLGQGVHDLLLSLNIGVEQTQNELEGRLLSGDKRHDGRLLGGGCR